MAKKSKEPPSLFDNLDLFAAAQTPGGDAGAEGRDGADGAAEDEAAGAAPENGEGTEDAAGREGAEDAAEDGPGGKAAEGAASEGGLTGRGPLRDLMDSNFLQFAGYVICSRAIPAVEDGLKPVQRRILHSLYEKDDKRFTKVANIVGHAMQYHPHGDASIGDALVVLANKLWSEDGSGGYVIRGQGNFGNIYTGMPAAAPRYIECQLSDLARNEVFNPKTTEYVPSYDGRNKEPVLLPAKIPLLLMFGADGIAVGLSTAILPHNFPELLQAEIDLIRKKPVVLYPDFQLGGTMDVSEYDDGRGKVKVRAAIEPREKNKLVVTQLPWGETTDSLIADIEEAIKKKKVDVRQIHDLTAKSVEIELVLTAGASQEKTTAALYAFTKCEKSVASRPVVLDAGRPRELTVTQILQRSVDRLMFLVRRELEIRLDELAAEFHAKTLDQIFIEERVYKRIESEKSWEGVRKAVFDGLAPFRPRLRKDVTEEDVERLLKIPIRRISQYDIDKNRREIEDILAEERQTAKDLDDLKNYVVKYLKNLIKTYQKKYPRCTKIAAAPFKQADVRAMTATELTIRSDGENHFVGWGVRGGDELFKCSSLDKLLFVWKDGRYKMMPPPEKLFVDKDLLCVAFYSRDREYTCVYTEPDYGFSYIKRFTFGGMIQNKEYRLAPEKSKLLFFSDGCPETLYVKYRPAKSQRIHQQAFYPSEVTVRGASARGLQMTSKAIAKISQNKCSWWDDSEKPEKGLFTD